MSEYDIYGLGAALVDTEIDVTDADLQSCGIEKGVMTLVDAARQQQLIEQLKDHLTRADRASGGSAANSIIAAQYFGAKAFYSCKVASDENGWFYLNDLARAGVAYSSDRSMTSQGVTGKCLVMITQDAERTMNTFLGVSESLSIAEVDPEALSRSSYLYLEGYLVTSATGRPAAVHARELAEKHGVKTALSLSDPGIVEFFRDGLQEMLGKGVDILFCNQAEALAFTQSQSLASAIESLKAHARTFAITLGAEGCVAFDGKELFEVGAPKVKALDTNGAGDMFAGAFLYALTRGQDYAGAARFANRAAAQVVSQYGPRLAPEQHKELLSWL